MTRKRLKSGELSYYWEPRRRDREGGFSMMPEPLGREFRAARDRATMLNGLLDSWREARDKPKSLDHGKRAGTIDWWVESYCRSPAFENVSLRTQSDYRDALNRLADLETKLLHKVSGHARRLGELPVASLSPAAVDKIYERLRQNGRVTRQANYTIDVARIAWRVVARAHPGLFLLSVDGPEGRKLVALNPFVGVTRIYGRGTVKPATREHAFALAGALTKIGHPALAAVALISFEWLQRPENIIAGHLTWTQYRPQHRPAHVEIFHHKTGKRMWLPLEDERGRLLYPELEKLLKAVPRVGVQIVMLVPQRGPKLPSGERPARLYSESHADHLVQKARAFAGLGKHITLAACRHGGMTELGDAGLTEQGIMALSGHATPSAARLYVKRTEVQRLAAAERRRDFVEGEIERSRIKSRNGT